MVVSKMLGHAGTLLKYWPCVFCRTQAIQPTQTHKTRNFYYLLNHEYKVRYNKLPNGTDL